MVQDKDLISVRNRNNGDTGYTIPDRNIMRTWAPNESKKIPFEELRAFSYLPGGLYALNNLLVVENKDALDALNMQVEPEYFYTEDDIRKILTEIGNYDAFADFLDFAPDGALEIAKTIAVEEEIPDVKKRDMLSEKTGLNINTAININKALAEDDEKDAEKEAPKQRRVAIEESKQETTQRRVAAPKYNVVSK